MIAHVVLFTPRPSLPPTDRRRLVADLERACVAIPAIRRARIGRRRRLGHSYDTLGPVQFEFVAVLEFDSEADLAAYLQHPHHVALGKWFHDGAEVALAEDFVMVDATALGTLATDEPAASVPPE